MPLTPGRTWRLQGDSGVVGSNRSVSCGLSVLTQTSMYPFHSRGCLLALGLHYLPTCFVIHPVCASLHASSAAMGCCHGRLSVPPRSSSSLPVYDQPSAYRPAAVSVPGPDSTRLHRVRPRRGWSYAACFCLVPPPAADVVQGPEAGAKTVNALLAASCIPNRRHRLLLSSECSAQSLNHMSGPVQGLASVFCSPQSFVADPEVFGSTGLLLARDTL